MKKNYLFLALIFVLVFAAVPASALEVTPVDMDEAVSEEVETFEEAEREASGNPFRDVSSDAFYYDAVLWAYENGITTGTSESTFGPLESCTRGQVVTFLWRAKGKPEPKTENNPFIDVKESDYYYKPILWAVEEGITQGTTAATFSPKDSCANAHIITFIHRSEGEPIMLDLYEEYAGHWYDESMSWGKSKGFFDPLGGSANPGEDSPRGLVAYYLYMVK